MNMKSSALALLLAFAAVSTGGVARAQQGARVYRVGALFNRGPNQGDQDVELLRQGLAQRGYVEGTNLVIGSPVRRRTARPASRVCRRTRGYGRRCHRNLWRSANERGPNATATIPIVAALVADPVALGFAATLARPGQNVTGITNHDPELAIRQLRILKEVFPTLERVAFLSDADIPGADASGLAPNRALQRRRSHNDEHHSSATESTWP